MRGIIIIVALVIILALVGWVTFSRGPGDRAGIQIETGKIREDTKDAMRSGAELLHKAGDKVSQQADKANGATQQTTTTTTTETK
jgi:hypothetical protein